MICRSLDDVAVEAYACPSEERRRVGLHLSFGPLAAAQSYRVAVAVDAHAVFRDVRHDIYGLLIVGLDIARLIHIEGVCRLLPCGEESFVVKWTNLVDASQALVGLTAAGVVVALQHPEELSAYAVFYALGQLCLALQYVAEFLLGVSFARMVAHGAPCAIFAVEQLVGLFQLVAVVFNLSSVGSAPVLHHVPVCTFASVACRYQAHGAACRVELAYYVRTFLGKVGRQGAFVLQSPQYYRRRVAALLHPLDKMALEALPELWRVIPYMG